MIVLLVPALICGIIGWSFPWVGLAVAIACLLGLKYGLGPSNGTSGGIGFGIMLILMMVCSGPFGLLLSIIMFLFTLNS